MVGSESGDFKTLDRDRGILTQSDREFLAGEKELSEQSKRDARYRIRKRVEEGILDLSFIYSYLAKKDRSQVAEKLFPSNDRGEIRALRAIALIFRMILDVEENDVDSARQRLKNDIEAAVTSVIRLMDDDGDYLLNVSVDIEIEREQPDIDELITKYESGTESMQELNYLRRHNVIPADSKYHRHSLGHMWEEGGTLHIPGKDGVEVISPANYDRKNEFIETALDAMRESPLDIIEDEEKS